MVDYVVRENICMRKNKAPMTEISYLKKLAEQAREQRVRAKRPTGK
ncbi:hypothetical protein GCM10009560_73590 [Nonomuraea longicatena]|uniref:Uncharacterized protein n=1 Tax=Nonomuraea longicatena TaxID=83682 RepID=A0ABP4BMW1_9ACTN